MIDKPILDVLFKEIHKAIKQASASFITKMQNTELSYPPGVEFSPDETKALSDLKLSEAAKSGLRKLVVDACSFPLFHFFSLLDGVADPEEELDDVWLGATIAEKTKEDVPMLHNEFYESYWLYKEE